MLLLDDVMHCVFLRNGRNLLSVTQMSFRLQRAVTHNTLLIRSQAITSVKQRTRSS